MERALTLVAPASSKLLSAERITQICRVLEDAGFAPSSQQVLAENESYRLTFRVDNAEPLETAINAAVGSLPIDVAILPARTGRARLLIADMDSTIIQCECLDELADLAGFGPQVSAITERAMRGELDFEGALRERVKMLAGLPEDRLAQTYQERITLMPGAKELVQTMNANGAVTALVSGGFTYFTSRVADEVGFQLNFGNTLDVVDGKLTGEVIDPILGREAKLATLEKLCAENNIAFEDVIAVGDGANDLAMIDRAGTGISYYGKPVVENGADASVKNTDLKTLLYLQGYRATEIKNPAG